MIEEEFPANLVEFEERFGSEDACRAYLTRVRWPDGYRVGDLSTPSDAHKPDIDIHRASGRG